MRAKVGLIRVVTLQDGHLLNAHGRLIERHFPGLVVASRCIPDQPDGIYDDETCRRALPKILKLGAEFEKESMRAILVSCADDPGVEQLRQIVRIPVLGAGSSCACLAMAFAGKIGTLGIRSEAPRCMREILKEHLMAQIRPEGIHTTLDLLTDQGREAALRAGELLDRSVCEVIALACTGYSTIELAAELRRSTRLPVLDAVVAAGLFCLHAIQAHAFPQEGEGKC